MEQNMDKEFIVIRTKILILDGGNSGKKKVKVHIHMLQLV